MGFSFRRVDAVHLSFILWLFVSVSRHQSVRPLDTEATLNVKQNASFVEVGASHFQRANISQREQPLSQHSKAAAPNGGVHQGTQQAGGMPDEWESDDPSDVEVTGSPPLQDTGDEEETGPAEMGNLPGTKPKSEETDPVPLHYQTPPDGGTLPDGETLTPRDPSLTPGISTGHRGLDEMGEEEEENEFVGEPTPTEEHKPGNDLLYVPKSPELSHEDRDERIEDGHLAPDSVDAHPYHFTETLHHKPMVEKAVGKWKSGLHKLKDTTQNIYKELGTAVEKFGQFSEQVNEVQRAAGDTKRALFSESRKAAVDSVDSFASYNKNGPEGEDRDGKFVPDVGKWNIFKGLLDEAENKQHNEGI